MTATLDITLRFQLEAEAARKLRLEPQYVPVTCYPSAVECGALAAKLVSAAAAQIVVVEQIAQQGGHLFAGHDWTLSAEGGCTCPACIITRAEAMFDELRELATP